MELVGKVKVGKVGKEGVVVKGREVLEEVREEAQEQVVLGLVV